MKKCSKCKVEKDLSEFSKNKSTNDGFHYSCKSCYKEYQKANSENLKEKSKKYSKANSEKIKEYVKEYQKNNIKKIKEYNKGYRKNNSEKIKEYHKEHYKNNREKKKEYQNKYEKNRRVTDPLYKLSCNLRSRTRQAFRVNFWQKNNTTAEILGASYEICAQNIENKFTEGMTWKNHGEWHIDHIIPLASAKTAKELITLCHYTNLQPLWAFDNLSKGNKMVQN